MTNITITATGKSEGTKKQFLLSGPADTLESFKEDFSGQCFIKDDCATVYATNKHQSEMYAFVERHNSAQAKTAAVTTNVNAPRRIVIGRGEFHVGQTVNGNVITGLGRAWATSGDNSMHGVSPEYTSVQYAYFN